jgi:outer membrane protein OmpA-like peptidoglycan-associated protein
MQHTYGLIAGASALAVAGVLSVQTGLVAGLGDEAPPAPVAALPAPPPAEPEPPAAVEASAAALESRIGTLETTLADREAALAEFAETLAKREANLAETTETLAARDAELEALRDELAARDARLEALRDELAARDVRLEALRDELAALRLELADLRERFAFDIQLASMKAEAPAPAADPVGPAPAPAADQPLTTICFDTGSASLTPGGQVHAAAAAVMLAGMKLGQIRLTGFTDSTGSPALNRTLAEARARAVADFLVAQGVPAQLIETAGVIDRDLPVPTEAGVPEPLNRSVSIVAVPLPTT